MLDIVFPSISATALFMLCLYNRYAAIIARIRSVDRERLSSTSNAVKNEYEYQTQLLLRRANYVRYAVCCLHGSMALLSTNGFGQSIRVLVNFDMSTTSVALMSSAFIFMTIATVISMYELYLSLKSIGHEARVFSGLAG